MDENTDSRFWSVIGKVFGIKNDPPVEGAIMDALQEGELRSDEVAMLLNVLRLGRKQVQEIVIPRPDIVCAEAESTIGDVAELIVSSGHSRIPLYEDNRDHMVGVVHAKDLMHYLRQPDGGAKPARKLMRTPFFIPETKNVKDLLQEFRTRKVHLAIALDEYGGTSGLVTFEDVLEEIVGEIEDEHDLPRPEEIQVLDASTLLISGRADLDDLQKRIGLQLDSDQVETIGGYLSELAGRVPEEGERFTLSGYGLTVEEADAKQIRWLKVEPPDPLDEALVKALQQKSQG